MSVAKADSSANGMFRQIHTWLSAMAMRGGLRLVLLAGAVLATGCAASATASEPAGPAVGQGMALGDSGQAQGEGLLVGRLIDGYYTTPLGKLRIKLPELDGRTAMVRDVYRDGLIGVMMWDGQGRLYRLDGQRLTPEQQALLAELSAQQKKMVMADAAVQPYLAFSPDAMVVETESMPGRLPEALLMVVRVPGGEPAVDDAAATMATSQSDEKTPAESAATAETASDRAIVVFRYVHGLYSASTVRLAGESLDAAQQRVRTFAEGIHFAGMGEPE